MSVGGGVVSVLVVVCCECVGGVLKYINIFLFIANNDWNFPDKYVVSQSSTYEYECSI